MAMELTERQYHDAHPEYSQAVMEKLDSFELWMQKATGDSCDKCKEAKAQDGRIPAPHFLAHRLNAYAAKLRAWLVWPPSVWRNPYFTSRYAKDYKAIEDMVRRFRGR